MLESLSLLSKTFNDHVGQGKPLSFHPCSRRGPRGGADKHPLLCTRTRTHGPCSGHTKYSHFVQAVRDSGVHKNELSFEDPLYCPKTLTKKQSPTTMSLNLREIHTLHLHKDRQNCSSSGEVFNSTTLKHDRKSWTRRINIELCVYDTVEGTSTFPRLSCHDRSECDSPFRKPNLKSLLDTTGNLTPVSGERDTLPVIGSSET